MSKISFIAVIGPTASGKSELAVKLAKQFNGEIISCDSRQIYKGLNLGTGKVLGAWKKTRLGEKLSTAFIYKNIPHHLIDFANPKKQFSVSEFKPLAEKAISNIQNRGKLPILCGGTAHYIDAVVYDQAFPEVPPNPKIRAELEKISASDLFARIGKQDPERAKTIDPHNKHRLIRALEIIHATGKPVPQLSAANFKSSVYRTLWLGIKTNQEQLYKKIEKRLKERLENGMVEEVKKLHKNGLSYKRLLQFGLEYKYITLYLQKKLSSEEMFTQLLYAIKHYSKRQLTWWKRNKEINWIDPDVKEATELVEKFLK